MNVIPAGTANSPIRVPAAIPLNVEADDIIVLTARTLPGMGLVD